MRNSKLTIESRENRHLAICYAPHRTEAQMLLRRLVRLFWPCAYGHDFKPWRELGRGARRFAMCSRCLKTKYEAEDKRGWVKSIGE